MRIMSKNSAHKAYKSPPEIKVAWMYASTYLKMGYRIVSIDKKGQSYYAVLSKS